MVGHAFIEVVKEFAVLAVDVVLFLLDFLNRSFESLFLENGRERFVASHGLVGAGAE
jgi:hypothetical protein